MAAIMVDFMGTKFPEFQGERFMHSQGRVRIGLALQFTIPIMAFKRNSA